MTDRTDTADTLAAGMALADPKDHGDGVKTVVVPDGYRVDTFDLLEYTGEGARRKTGEYTVNDPRSFAAYINRHGHTGTEVYADITRTFIEGVINGHEEEAPDGEPGHGQAGWQDHTVDYYPQKSAEWIAWATGDGSWMTQEAFAELIEDRAIDIVSPASADMLELAQTFIATKGVAFKSSKLLSSGERELEYRETVDARAGRAGTLEIPATFTLALRPFEGAEPYRVVARLRYRIDNETLRLGYKLTRPEDVLREAFDGVVAAIRDNIDAPVFMGARR